MNDQRRVATKTGNDKDGNDKDRYVQKTGRYKKTVATTHADGDSGPEPPTMRSNRMADHHHTRDTDEGRDPKRLRLRLEEEVHAAGARIKVIGVGGGGGNAINRMVRAGLDGVEFMVANTDMQALKTNAAPIKLQIGSKLTKGLGAGADPNVGPAAAPEDTANIIQALDGAAMIFV